MENRKSNEIKVYDYLKGETNIEDLANVRKKETLSNRGRSRMFTKPF
jgi:hypothetical protein